MTSSERRIIHATREMVMLKAGAFTDVFNHRLHHLAPALHKRLPAVAFDQDAGFATRLVTTIDRMCDRQRDNDRDGRFDVGELGFVWQPRDHAVIGLTLIAALADVLGPVFTEEARQAWTTGFVRLAETAMAASCNRLDLVA